MKIEKHIAKLLRNYDCVIIPRLGGFVANYAPSQFNMAKGVFTPPSKAIIFNRNLINNDGLLINHLSVEENISYSDASNAVQWFVDECRKLLNQGKRIEFDELGVLYEDNEKNLQFRPDFSVNFLTESFGLYPVVAKELVQTLSVVETIIEKSVISVVAEKPVEIKSEEKKIEREIKHQIRENEIKKSDDNLAKQTEEKKIIPIRKRRTGRYIAIAAVSLPIIFYSVWIPLKTDVIKTGMIEVADLNPFSSPKAASVYNPSVERASEKAKISIMPSEEELKNEEPVIEIPVTNEIDTTLVDDSNVIAEEIRSQHQYHVIAGCFKEDENALRMVEYLKAKGYNAFILDTVNGLKRVSASSHANIGEAVSTLREIRGNQVSEAWVLSR